MFRSAGAVRGVLAQAAQRFLLWVCPTIADAWTDVALKLHSLLFVVDGRATPVQQREMWAGYSWEPGGRRHVSGVLLGLGEYRARPLWVGGRRAGGEFGLASVRVDGQRLQRAPAAVWFEGSDVVDGG